MPLHDHFLSESLDQFIRSRGCYSLHSLGVILPTGEKPHSILSCVNTCEGTKPKIINSEIKENFEHRVIFIVFSSELFLLEHNISLISNLRTGIYLY